MNTETLSGTKMKRINPKIFLVGFHTSLGLSDLTNNLPEIVKIRRGLFFVYQL